MKDGTFLQSQAWEDFQQRIGRTVLRIDDILVVEYSTPVGKYWYIARAALRPKQVHLMTEAAKKAGLLCIRIDPLSELQLTTHNSQLTKPTQPQTTLVLDLAPSEEALLQSFQEKSRYNIKLAERKGVTIEDSNDPDGRALHDFLHLIQQTGRRHDIRPHGEEYYRTMLEVLNQRNPSRSPFTEREKNQMPPSLGKEGQGEISASIVTAYHGDQPLAANLMIWSEETAYYLHGASDHSQRSLMAPHLLQWTCIQAAKRRGATKYDFWGIAPPVGEALRVKSKASLHTTPAPDGPHALPFTPYRWDAKHPWSGITRFKLGFGGQVVSYPPSIDVILDPLRYRLYQAGRALRRVLRDVLG